MNTNVSALPAEELQAFNDLARRYARKELPAHRIDHEYPWPRDIVGAISTAAGAGLFGINTPADLGGCGMGAAALAGVLREVAAVDGGVAGLLFTHATAMEIIVIGTDDGQAMPGELASCLVAPDGMPLAFASCTAPEEQTPLRVTGSDMPHLSGTVPFLVLGGVARYAVVAGAREQGDNRSHYLVDLHHAGVQRTEPLVTLGFQCCRVVDVRLDNVPATLIGAEGDGDRQFRTMQARMAAGAVGLSLGLMEGALHTALDYARQRFQGGRYLIDWSALRMKLADMAIRVDVARTCLSGLLAAPAPSSRDDFCMATATMLHVSDLACSVTSDGIQLLGGNGYMKDYGQEKRLRDARQARTLFGTTGLTRLNHIDSLIREQMP